MDKDLFSNEAEKALIGAVLYNADYLIELDLSSSDFYIDRHKVIWASVMQLQHEGISPDYVTVLDSLERKNQYQKDLDAYLTGLINNTPFGAQVSEYANTVREYAVRRRALQAAKDIASLAYDLDRDISSPLADIVDRLVQGVKPKIGAVHWGEVISRLYDLTSERSKNPQKIWGIPTGFDAIDQFMGGLQEGEVLYIAGEPGAGKSILANQMGLNMATLDYPGAIYSLEMKDIQIMRRIISGLVHVETRKIKSGDMDAEDWKKFIEGCEQAKMLPVYLCDESNLTTTSLRADLARLKARYGIKWFVLDYLQLMSDGDGKLNDTERSALISRRIKNITSELSLAAITVNSVTKDGMGGDETVKKPSMKMLRGSGQVVHDADTIGILQEFIGDFPPPNKKNLRTFTLVKGRELETIPSYCHLEKFEKWAAFSDVDVKKIQLNGK